MGVGLAGVAVALLAGGLALYWLMTTALDRSLDEAARLAATEVAELAHTGRLPDPLPSGRAPVVQVLDDENRVVAASVAADRLTAVVTPAEREAVLAGGAVVVPGYRAALDGRLRVSGVAVEDPSGDRLLVVAASPTTDTDTSRLVLRTLLLVAFPLVLAIMAAVAWRIIGAVLRPVEDLRAGAERIGAEAEGAQGFAARPPERLMVPGTRDEIAALARTLNDMLDALDRARLRQRSFVADAAHELRSPLANLRTQLDVALRLGEAGPLTARLDAEVDRLSGLVEDLLTLAMATDGAAPVAQDVEGSAIADLLAAVISRYRQARVPVIPDLSRPPGSVHLARVDLERTVTNLLDNAVRHAATTVTVRLARAASGLEITIADDGRGIEEADRERVFERFTRLEEARDRDSGGSGLGMAIAQALMRRNGGRIELHDNSPGLRAVVVLPLGSAGTTHWSP
jgi:signal transduction histidine kinase